MKFGATLYPCDVNTRDVFANYEVRALDFVVKPVNYYSFAIKMQSAIQMTTRRKVRNIIVTTGTGMEKFSTDELYYAETNGHYISYHTSGALCGKRAR